MQINPCTTCFYKRNVAFSLNTDYYIYIFCNVSQSYDDME